MPGDDDDVDDMDGVQVGRERLRELRRQSKDIRILVIMTAAHVGTSAIPQVVQAVQHQAPAVGLLPTAFRVLLAFFGFS